MHLRRFGLRLSAAVSRLQQTKILPYLKGTVIAAALGVAVTLTALPAHAAPVAWTDGTYHFNIVPGTVDGIAGDPKDLGDTGSRFNMSHSFEWAFPGGSMDIVVSGGGTTISVPGDTFLPDTLPGTLLGTVDFRDHSTETGDANQYTIPHHSFFEPGGTVTGPGDMEVLMNDAFFIPQLVPAENSIPLRLWTAPYEATINGFNNTSYNFAYKVDGRAFDGQTMRLVATGDSMPGSAYDGVAYQMVLELQLVPEPASWLLLGSGLMGLAVFSRRRRA